MEMTGICSHAGFFQGTADKADVVGGTAAAAGLGNDDGCFAEVIFAGQVRHSMICPTTIREG